MCLCGFGCSYIFQRIRRDGDDNTVVTREQLGGQELSDPGHKAILQSIHQISDELDGNAELQRQASFLLNGQMPVQQLKITILSF